MLVTICYGVISFLLIVTGIAAYIRMFPKRRWNSRGAAVLFYCLMLGFSAVQAWDSTHGFIPYIQIVLNGILNSILMKVFYVCSFKTALVWMWLYNLVISFFKVPFLTCRGVSEGTNLINVNVLGGRTFGETTWCFIILCSVWWLIIKKQKAITFLKQLMEKRFGILYFFGAEFIAVLLLLFMIKATSAEDFDTDDIAVNVLIIFGIVLGTAVYVFRSLYVSSRIQKNYLESKRELLEKENNVIRLYCEEEAKRVHDIRHILLFLDKCIEEGKISEAKTCLKKHLTQTRVYGRKIWTGITDIDYILNYKYILMQRCEIDFKVDIEVYSCPISGEQLMIILGNLLDNAMEAVCKCPVSERKIELKLKEINDIFFIESKNPCIDPPKKRTDRIVLWEKDTIEHGWGLENIEEIVKEHNGIVQYAIGERSFTIKVMIYKKEGTE